MPIIINKLGWTDTNSIPSILICENVKFSNILISCKFIGCFCFIASLGFILIFALLRIAIKAVIIIIPKRVEFFDFLVLNVSNCVLNINTINLNNIIIAPI